MAKGVKLKLRPVIRVTYNGNVVYLERAKFQVDADKNPHLTAEALGADVDYFQENQVGLALRKSLIEKTFNLKALGREPTVYTKAPQVGADPSMHHAVVDFGTVNEAQYNVLIKQLSQSADKKTQYTVVKYNEGATEHEFVHKDKMFSNAGISIQNKRAKYVADVLKRRTQLLGKKIAASISRPTEKTTYKKLQEMENKLRGRYQQCQQTQLIEERNLLGHVLGELATQKTGDVTEPTEQIRLKNFSNRINSLPAALTEDETEELKQIQENEPKLKEISQLKGKRELTDPEKRDLQDKEKAYSAIDLGRINAHQRAYDKDNSTTLPASLKWIQENKDLKDLQQFAAFEKNSTSVLNEQFQAKSPSFINANIRTNTKNLEETIDTAENHLNDYQLACAHQNKENPSITFKPPFKNLKAFNILNGGEPPPFNASPDALKKRVKDARKQLETTIKNGKPQAEKMQLAAMEAVHYSMFKEHKVSNITLFDENKIDKKSKKPTGLCFNHDTVPTTLRSDKEYHPSNNKRALRLAWSALNPNWANKRLATMDDNAITKKLKEPIGKFHARSYAACMRWQKNALKGIAPIAANKDNIEKAATEFKSLRTKLQPLQDKLIDFRTTWLKLDDSTKALLATNNKDDNKTPVLPCLRMQKMQDVVLLKQQLNDLDSQLETINNTIQASNTELNTKKKPADPDINNKTLAEAMEKISALKAECATVNTDAVRASIDTNIIDPLKLIGQKAITARLDKEPAGELKKRLTTFQTTFDTLQTMGTHDNAVKWDDTKKTINDALTNADASKTAAIKKAIQNTNINIDKLDADKTPSYQSLKDASKNIHQRLDEIKTKKNGLNEQNKTFKESIMDPLDEKVNAAEKDYKQAVNQVEKAQVISAKANKAYQAADEVQGKATKAWGKAETLWGGLTANKTEAAKELKVATKKLQQTQLLINTQKLWISTATTPERLKEYETGLASLNTIKKEAKTTVTTTKKTLSKIDSAKKALDKAAGKLDVAQTNKDTLQEKKTQLGNKLTEEKNTAQKKLDELTPLQEKQKDLKDLQKTIFTDNLTALTTQENKLNGMLGETELMMRDDKVHESDYLIKSLDKNGLTARLACLKEGDSLKTADIATSQMGAETDEAKSQLANTTHGEVCAEKTQAAAKDILDRQDKILDDPKAREAHMEQQRQGWLKKLKDKLYDPNWEKDDFQNKVKGLSDGAKKWESSPDDTAHKMMDGAHAMTRQIDESAAGRLFYAAILLLLSLLFGTLKRAGNLVRKTHQFLQEHRIFQGGKNRLSFQDKAQIFIVNSAARNNGVFDPAAATAKISRQDKGNMNVAQHVIDTETYLARTAHDAGYTVKTANMAPRAKENFERYEKNPSQAKEMLHNMFGGLGKGSSPLTALANAFHNQTAGRGVLTTNPLTQTARGAGKLAGKKLDALAGRQEKQQAKDQRQRNTKSVSTQEARTSATGGGKKPAPPSLPRGFGNN
jgi:hypothetical protein